MGQPESESVSLHLYTIGYRDAEEGKRREPEEFYSSMPAESVVVDIRSHPYSPFCPPYTGRGVAAAVNLLKPGVKAFYHIKALGNTHREGSGKRVAPPHFFDAETGFRRLEEILREHDSAVVFCACSYNTICDSRYRCHRFFAAEEMKERIPALEVTHLL